MIEVKPVTVQLEHPVQYGDETVSAITFARPLRMSDLYGVKMSQLQEMDFEALALIVSRLTGYDRQVISRLEGNDVLAVLEAFGPFMPIGRQTGS